MCWENGTKANPTTFYLKPIYWCCYFMHQLDENARLIKLDCSIRTYLAMSISGAYVGIKVSQCLTEIWIIAGAIFVLCQSHNRHNFSGNFCTKYLGKTMWFNLGRHVHHGIWGRCISAWKISAGFAIGSDATSILRKKDLKTFSRPPNIFIQQYDMCVRWKTLIHTITRAEHPFLRKRISYSRHEKKGRRENSLIIISRQL